MFGRGKESGSVPTSSVKFDTVLGPEVKFTGTLKGKGSIRIEGEVEGQVEYEGDVVVGEKAVVRADIKARNVTIAGRVEGNVTAIGRLELVATAKLVGDMRSAALVLAEGALFQGRSEMGNGGQEDKPKQTAKRARDGGAKP